LNNHSENGIATAIRVFAYVVIAAGVLGFVFNLDGKTATLLIGVAFLASGAISGLMLLGFSEVIFLLQDLNSGGYRRSEPTQSTAMAVTQAKPAVQANAAMQVNAAMQHQEPIRKFSANEFDKTAFLNQISTLERVSEMYESVSQTAANNPNLFSQDIMNQLEDCVDIERMYGKGSGKQSFLAKLQAYLREV